MEWHKYPHIERLENEEVDGLLLLPEIWIEPKIDGANASVHMVDGELKVAKRTQVLGDGDDFRGLKTFIESQKEKFVSFFTKYPNTVIYGEWLVKHTISWYRPGAYNRFYAFDVVEEGGLFWRPDVRMERLKEFDIEMIVPIAKLHGLSYAEEHLERLRTYSKTNKFLIDDTEKLGEGIVVKAFTGDQPYRNRFGRTTWAKIVRQEFKEKNTVAMGISDLKFKRQMEQEFVDQFVTPARVEKIKQKIQTEKGTGWKSKYIGELLGRTYYDIFSEELWGFVKKQKVGKFNFKIANQLAIARVKQIAGI